MSLVLSVLDLSPVANGTPPSQAIQHTVALARRADELGYRRYWVAEHHNMPSIATSAPEVLIGHLASVTSRIRVGAGGIMLPNHTPLRVVEIFRTLEALHPGRIDLGLGRAPGTDPLTAGALRRSARTDVDDLLVEVLAFGRGSFPDNHPYRDITAMPSDVKLPPIWMLGSTTTGAGIAAALGVGFAFAGHFAMRDARAAIRLYRERFRPSSELASPYAILACNVVCGENDAHARELAAPLRLAVVRLRTGRPAPIATVPEALAYPFTAQENAIADDFLSGAVIAGPAAMDAELEGLARDVGADELMISSLIADPADRIGSYERLAHCVGLGGAVV